MMHSRRFSLFVATMAAAVLANAAMLLSTTWSSFPFRPHADDSLRLLVETEQKSLGLDHSFYVDLAEIAGGHTLVTDVGDLEDTLVDGLADMTLSIEPLTDVVDPNTLAAMAGTRGTVRLAGADTFEYLLITPAPDEPRVRLIAHDHLLIAIGERELADLANP